jgi:hypothetical protein
LDEILKTVAVREIQGRTVLMEMRKQPAYGFHQARLPASNQNVELPSGHDILNTILAASAQEQAVEIFAAPVDDIELVSQDPLPLGPA